MIPTRRKTFLGCALALGAFIPLESTQAWPEAVLYSFSGAAGNSPNSGLLAEGGNFFGTTEGGGAYGFGAVFQLKLKTRTETVLYSFTGGNDGSDPDFATLIKDKVHNLYGETAAGGECGEGVLFKVAPKTGTETVIHSFCGSDGALPIGGLTADKAGDLYGTTEFGGSGNCTSQEYPPGCGTIFEVSATNNTFTVLHSFTNSDGANPVGGVIVGKKGNLFGTTYAGGTDSYGTVFEIPANSTLTVLHSFTKSEGDGAYPVGSLIEDKIGNLYGTTQNGGNAGCYENLGCGTVFELSPQRGGGWAEQVLYAFNGGPNDGEIPAGKLLLDKVGNIYGTTEFGGSGIDGNGTAFELAPDDTETVLYNFCSQSNCSDGSTPVAGLIMDKVGNLYGTTEYGAGSSNGGVVYELTPP
jgi:uncharacterized repeat protein (TIGR03803 family)